MSLINYKDIDFKKSINKENKIINFNGSEIRVVNYLSIHDKYDLIMTTIKKSYENEMYNPIKLDMYFNIHLIYLYTNIIFDSEDRADVTVIYDNFKNSGLLALVKEAIDPNELNDLQEKLAQTLQVCKEYNSSVTGFLSNLLNEVMDKIGSGLDTLKDIDPNLLSNILKNNPQLAAMIPSENN